MTDQPSNEDAVGVTTNMATQEKSESPDQPTIDLGEKSENVQDGGTKVETEKPSEKEAHSLARKLALVADEIGAVRKSGQNRQQNYAFIEYAVLGGRIRPLFAKYGLVFVPEVTKIIKADTISSGGGKVGYHFILEMKFTIIDADDPSQSITSKWLGEASDFGDKGINKAETSAVKYFLMRLFHVTEKGEGAKENEREADSESPQMRPVSAQNRRAPSGYGRPAHGPGTSEPPRNKPWQRYAGGQTRRPTDKQLRYIEQLLMEGGSTPEAATQYMAAVQTQDQASQAIENLQRRIREVKNAKNEVVPEDIPDAVEFPEAGGEVFPPEETA